MPTSLSLTFRAAPLPNGWSGTPQDFLDAIVARLAADAPDSIGFFVTGTTAPLTNVGPWLKDGTTWYVWSNTAGQYVPEVLDTKSYRYIASVAAPSQIDYTFWIELSSAGKAKSIRYYYAGSWVDVYEDKFAEYTTTANLPAAVKAAVNSVPFRAYKSAAAQAYTSGTGDVQVVFDVENFDTGSLFASNRFTAAETGYYDFHAQIYLSLTAGTPTVLDRQLKLRVNGNEVTNDQAQVNDDTDGVVLRVSDTRFLNAGDYVDAAVYVTSTGAGTWSILNDSTTTFFKGHRLFTT